MARYRTTKPRTLILIVGTAALALLTSCTAQTEQPPAAGTEASTVTGESNEALEQAAVALFERSFQLNVTVDCGDEIVLLEAETETWCNITDVDQGKSGATHVQITHVVGDQIDMVLFPLWNE